MSFLLERTPPKNPLRRHPVALPLIIFFLLLALLGLIGKKAQGPQIGLLKVEGMILDSSKLLTQIRFLEKQESVRGVLLRVDSPGGVVAPSQEIYSALKRLGQKKPLYVSMGSVAASGGYYVSLAGKQIFANQGTLTGSIGVILQSLNAKELLDKLGLKMQVVKSGRNKDAGSLFRPMEPEERKLLESVIMDSHDQFVSAIAENRPIKRAELELLADGRIFTGRQAQALGLVDQVGGIEEALEALKKTLSLDKEEVELIEPPDPKESFWSPLDLEQVSQIGQLLGQGGLLFMDPKLGPR
ncbi:MAG: signal peptide peptidase SppA [bacterium]|nr:signal peptide peptidase SppA [bacterium]